MDTVRAVNKARQAAEVDEVDKTTVYRYTNGETHRLPSSFPHSEPPSPPPLLPPPPPPALRYAPVPLYLLPPPPPSTSPRDPPEGSVDMFRSR